MSFAITGQNGFVSKLASEGARSSLFEVIVSLKGQNILGTEDADNTFQYMCKGIQLPSQNLGVVLVNYFGRAIKLPGDRTYEDLTMTIINDEDHSVRNRLENWMNIMNDYVANTREADASRDEYTADLTIKTYNKDGSELLNGEAEWKFINCFPITVDQIDLAWDANDQVMEFTSTWVYDYWTHGAQVT